MIGVILVLAYIALNVLVLAVDGAHRTPGGLKAWWLS
jgi:hypothetical protein